MSPMLRAQAPTASAIAESLIPSWLRLLVALVLLPAVALVVVIPSTFDCADAGAPLSGITSSDVDLLDDLEDNPDTALVTAVPGVGLGGSRRQALPFGPDRPSPVTSIELPPDNRAPPAGQIRHLIRPTSIQAPPRVVSSSSFQPHPARYIPGLSGPAAGASALGLLEGLRSGLSTPGSITLTFAHIDTPETPRDHRFRQERNAIWPR